MAEKLGSLDVEIRASIDQFAAQMGQAVQSLDKLAVGLKKSSEAVQKAGADIDAAGSKFSTFRANIIAANQGIELLGRTFSVLKGAVVSIGELIDRGQGIVELTNSFNHLQAAAGQLATEGLAPLREATAGLVADQDLMRVANEAMLAGLKPEQFQVAASAADAFGDAVGKNTTEALNDLVRVLDSGNPKLLKQYGIYIDLTAAATKYADSIGTTADKLSDAEKRQANQIAITEKIIEKQKTLGTSAETAGDALQRMEKAGQNLGDRLGEAFTKNETLTAGMLQLADAIQKVKAEDFATVLNAIAASAGFAARQIGNFVNGLDALFGSSQHAKLLRIATEIEDLQGRLEAKGLTALFNLGFEIDGEVYTPERARAKIKELQDEFRTIQSPPKQADLLGVGAFVGDFYKTFVENIDAVQARYNRLIEEARKKAEEEAKQAKAALEEITQAEKQSRGELEKSTLGIQLKDAIGAGDTEKARQLGIEYAKQLEEGTALGFARGVEKAGAPAAEKVAAITKEKLAQAIQEAFAQVDASIQQTLQETNLEGLRAKVEDAFKTGDLGLADKLQSEIRDAVFSQAAKSALTQLRLAGADATEQSLKDAEEKAATYGSAIRQQLAVKDARKLEEEQKKAFQASVGFYEDLLTSSITGSTQNLEQTLKDALKRVAIGFGAQILANIGQNVGINLSGITSAGGLGQSLAASLGFGGGGVKTVSELLSPASAELTTAASGLVTAGTGLGTAGTELIASATALGTSATALGGAAAAQTAASAANPAIQAGQAALSAYSSVAAGPFFGGGAPATPQLISATFSGGTTAAGAGATSALPGLVAAAVPVAVAAVAAATAVSVFNSFKAGTKEGVEDGVKSGFDDIGDLGLALASGGLSVPLRAGAAVIGGLTSGADFDPEHRARKAVEKFLEDTFKDLKGASFFGQPTRPGGAKPLVPFSGNFDFGDAAKQFKAGGWAEQMQKFGAESASVFDALGKSLVEVLGITEDVGAQIGFVLQQDLAGNIDNARILVKDLGISFEDVEKAMLDAARNGEISWKQFNDTLAGVAPAFGEGLVAVGDLKGAWDEFIQSGNVGVQTLEGIRNIAIEAGEAGVKNFDDLKNKMVALGVPAEQINKFFQAMQQHGVDLKGSLDQIKNAGDVALGGIAGSAQDLGVHFADIPKNVLETNKHLQDTNKLLQQTSDTITKIPTHINIKFDVEGAEQVRQFEEQSAATPAPAAATKARRATAATAAADEEQAARERSSRKRPASTNPGITGSPSDLNVSGGGTGGGGTGSHSSTHKPGKKPSSGSGANAAASKQVADLLAKVQSILDGMQESFVGEADLTQGVGKTLSDLWAKRAQYTEAQFDAAITALAKASSGTKDSQTQFLKALQAVADEARQANSEMADAIKKTQDALRPITGHGIGAADFDPNAIGGLAANAQSAFAAIGRGLAESLGVAASAIDDVSKKIAASLAANLGGNIDLLRRSVGDLKLDFESAAEAILAPAREGKISWGEFAKQIAGLEGAFQPGLEAFAHITGAFNNLVTSHGTGFQAIQSVRDLAIEAMEAGAKTLEEAKDMLLKANFFNPADVNKFFDAVENVIGAVKGTDLAAALTDNKGAFKDQADFLRILGAVKGLGAQAITPDTFAGLKAQLGDTVSERNVDTLRVIIEQLITSSLSDLAGASDVTAGTIVGAMQNAGFSFFAKGAAFDRGGVVHTPRSFFFGQGKLGRLGEVGPEAIMPLSRTASGRLGVMAAGGSAGNSVSYNIDARGAAPGVEQSIQRVLDAHSDIIVQRAVKATGTSRRRGGFYGNAFGRA